NGGGNKERAGGETAKAAKDEPVVTPVVMGNTEAWRMSIPPQPEVVVVRNATVWTAGPHGTLEGADLLIKNGRIAGVGKHLPAPPTIKFALGENPKQSNWDDRPLPPRYPQSRAGVEETIRDAFTRARDYKAAWEEWRHKKRPYPPRRDLQLDALLEIVEGRRFIHCHSYRQDEILMLMRLAEQFGIKVQTFQHVLEGYKVADEMASHGAGASTFSDWWAYKFEVIDAIPYNGYLMWDRGVTVSYNSDSDELARRLNTEAA